MGKHHFQTCYRIAFLLVVDHRMAVIKLHDMGRVQGQHLMFNSISACSRMGSVDVPACWGSISDGFGHPKHGWSWYVARSGWEWPHAHDINDLHSNVEEIRIFRETVPRMKRAGRREAMPSSSILLSIQPFQVAGFIFLLLKCGSRWESARKIHLSELPNQKNRNLSANSLVGQRLQNLIHFIQYLGLTPVFARSCAASVQGC